MKNIEIAVPFVNLNLCMGDNCSHLKSYRAIVIFLTNCVFTSRLANQFTSYGDSIWATSWENLFLPHANNKGADQPAHSCSLISTFVFRCLDSIISLVSISEIWSLYIASVAAQAGLRLTWSQTPRQVFSWRGSFMTMRNLITDLLLRQLPRTNWLFLTWKHEYSLFPW